jgi:preprotein translocase subunit SecG
MLTFSIYLLTAIMVIDCLFLVLLVLVQLPKKEAGMGQAFGGAATDALFGAGSGNVLTKVTKWAAGIFFALAIALTVMGTYKTTTGGGARLQERLSGAQPTAPVAPAPVASNPAPANPAFKLDIPPAANPPVNAAPAPAATNTAPGTPANPAAGTPAAPAK